MVASNTGGRLAPRRPFNYQPWFDNARRLKDLVAKLEIASVHSVEQTEKTHKGRIPQAQHPPASTRPKPTSTAPGGFGGLTSPDVPPEEPHPNAFQ